MVISPNGRWLVTVSEVESARLWDLQSADPAASVTVLDGVRGNTLLISRNSRWLVTCGRYWFAKEAPTLIWDLTRDNVAEFPIALPGQQPDHRTHACVLSPDRRWLTVGNEDGTARRYDLDADDPVATMETLGSPMAVRPVRSLATHSHGRLTFVSRWGQDAGELWTTVFRNSKGRHRERFLSPLDEAETVAISPDGRWLIAGTDDRNVHLWDLTCETAEEFDLSHMVLKGYQSTVNCIKISADSRWLVTSDGNTIRVWDLNVDRLLARARRAAGRTLTDQERTIFGVAATTARRSLRSSN
jgi:WD40 repeat protein